MQCLKGFNDVCELNNIIPIAQVFVYDLYFCNSKIFCKQKYLINRQNVYILVMWMNMDLNAQKILIIKHMKHLCLHI